MEETKYFVQSYRPGGFVWITREGFAKEELARDRLKEDRQVYPKYTFRLIKRTIIEEDME